MDSDVEKKEVTIIGGGVVGLTAALGMEQRGFTVTLLDAGPLAISNSNTPSPRAYAINHASQRLFMQLKVWDALDKRRVSPYQHMHVWDAQNKAHIDFDSRLIAAAQLGFIIDENNLRQALLHKISSTDITLLPQSTVTFIKESANGVAIGFGKQHLQSKLLLIADGASSPTRQLLKIEMNQWSYHQEALVTTVKTEKSHQQTAFQVFTSNGALALLPLVDEHQCSIVWSGPPALTQQRLSDADEVFNQQITAAFESKLGKIQVLTQRHAFPLQMRHVKQYTGAHWLMLGDAAHTIHPLAGLGLNLGLADLTHWLMLLDKSNAVYTKKTLLAYQRQRKSAVWQTIALMEGLKTLFLNPLPPIAMIRGFGLNLCNQINPLKRLLIQHAAG